MQEKETKPKVKAIKKMPIKPPFSDLASTLFINADGNVISKAPKNEMPNTTNKTKNAKLNQTLVAKLFIASAPKIKVTPKPNKI